MVYDAGHWNHDDVCLDAVKDVVPAGESIDLMVLSHSDSDHLAAVDEIFDEYKVDRVIRSGNTRWLTKTWREAYWAIRRARNAGDTADVNVWKLPNHQIQPGFSTDFGEVTIVQVGGWTEPPDSWDIKGKSERNNAGSIVIRLDYKGKSVLFTGNTVGRHIVLAAWRNLRGAGIDASKTIMRLYLRTAAIPSTRAKIVSASRSSDMTQRQAQRACASSRKRDTQDLCTRG